MQFAHSEKVWREKGMAFIAGRIIAHAKQVGCKRKTSKIFCNFLSSLAAVGRSVVCQNSFFPVGVAADELTFSS